MADLRHIFSTSNHSKHVTEHDPDWIGFQPSFATVIMVPDVEKVVIHRANGVYTYWSEEVPDEEDGA